MPPVLLIRSAVRRTPLGLVQVAATDRGVCSVEFGTSRSGLAAALRRRFPRAAPVRDTPAFIRLVRRVIRLVGTRAADAGLSLDLQGTPFQHRVWRALRRIQPGRTTTYAALARRVGRPAAVRAVAGACAANRVAVVVPCHRVVRQDGALSGYRWGTDRKRALLRREGAPVSG